MPSIQLLVGYLGDLREGLVMSRILIVDDDHYLVRLLPLAVISGGWRSLRIAGPRAARP